MSERLVVIGADAAGMSAASQARRQKSKDELAIVAFDRGSYTSYSACGIPYLIGDVVDDVDRLIARTVEGHQARDIEVHLRHEVVGIDTTAGSITVRDLESGRETSESYDHLLIATGAKPVRPPWPNSDAQGIFGIQTLDDGLAVGSFLDERRPETAVVVGGGYIGIEMAEALKTRGLEVTVVDSRPQPMTTLDPDMGALVAAGMSSVGIGIRCSTTVVAFDVDNGGVSGVITEEGDTIPADIVTLGLGAVPNVDLAVEGGLSIGPADGIVVDDHMRTETDRVWAAGDCVEKHHRITGQPVAIALGTHANKEGRVAGTNLGGGDVAFPGVVGTAVSKVCDLEVARTGLREDEAADVADDVATFTVDSTTRAGYFPGAAPITTKLIVDPSDGRLLGAQIVGEEGAAKRIDVLATTLWNEMTVHEIYEMDLSYAPPFSPVWDPVLIAARKASETLRRGR